MDWVLISAAAGSAAIISRPVLPSRQTRSAQGTSKPARSKRSRRPRDRHRQQLCQPGDRRPGTLRTGGCFQLAQQLFSFQQRRFDWKQCEQSFAPCRPRDSPRVIQERMQLGAGLDRFGQPRVTAFSIASRSATKPSAKILEPGLNPTVAAGLNVPSSISSSSPVGFRPIRRGRCEGWHHFAARARRNG